LHLFHFIALVVFFLMLPVPSFAQNEPGSELPPLLLETQPLLPTGMGSSENSEAETGGSPVVDSAATHEEIVHLSARLTETSAPLREGLVWRIFSLQPDFNNRLPLLTLKEGGSAEFRLAPDKYLVHVAFGRVQMTKQVEIVPDRTHYETIVLDAGGMTLDAIIPNSDRKTTINKERVKFAIHDMDKTGEDSVPIVQGVKTGSVVRLKAGLYHVVSTYGSANAITNANIRVEAGKLTEAVMEHRAAQVTLKLVRTPGGEALADTSWAITNASGDTVREIANAYVYLVLAEGDYTAYARNKEQNYQQEFTVVAGQDMEIDVLTTTQNAS